MNPQQRQAPTPAQLQVDQDPWLQETQAAKLLGVQPVTMRAWRTKDLQNAGAGDYLRKSPPHEVHNGRPRYRMSSLRQWLATLPKEQGIPVFPDNRLKRHRELARAAR